MVIRTPAFRYATAERFALPRPVAEVEEVAGAMCPQLPSRLERIMGAPHDVVPQSEDCLHLVVATPALDAGARPVLVWLHGGGFSSGAGLQGWYDGSALAEEHDVVVVSVNYRLGPLGFFHGDGVPADLGLEDQLVALRWVQAHIAGFGGDPAQVTVFGQSAGGMSISRMLQRPQARGLFSRAILQSAPVGLMDRPRADAEAAGRMWLDELGADPRSATLEQLLEAHRRTAPRYTELAGNPMAPLFSPVEEDGLTLGDATGLDVLYGWNADEHTAFAGTDDEQLYAAPLGAFGARLRDAGARVHSYRLDWRPAGSPFGATHCVELPLLLGGEKDWQGSPMLGTAPWAEVAELGASLRAEWAAFARTGEPGTTRPGRPITWMPG
jgi:para-nitrobenzyl esterase